MYIPIILFGNKRDLFMWDYNLWSWIDITEQETELYLQGKMK